MFLVGCQMPRRARDCVLAGYVSNRYFFDFALPNAGKSLSDFLHEHLVAFLLGVF